MTPRLWRCAVRSIDGETFPDPGLPGPVTNKLMDAYQEEVNFDYVGQYLAHLSD